MSKALQIPIDTKIKELPELPFTISFVIRKKRQVDGFYELPKDKRPPERMMWEGNGDELDEWLDKVLSGKSKPVAEFIIREDEIE